MWVQSFFLFSLVWAFGSILNSHSRKEFEEHIKSKLVFNEEEIAAQLQLKAKQMTKGVVGATLSPNQTATPKPTP